MLRRSFLALLAAVLFPTMPVRRERRSIVIPQRLIVGKAFRLPDGSYIAAEPRYWRISVSDQKVISGFRAALSAESRRGLQNH
jgi:hypothetical protein